MGRGRVLLREPRSPRTSLGVPESLAGQLGHPGSRGRPRIYVKKTTGLMQPWAAASGTEKPHGAWEDRTGHFLVQHPEQPGAGWYSGQ